MPKRTSKTHTAEGVPYMDVTWEACFRMAFAFLVMFGVAGLIIGVFAAALSA